MQMQLAEIVRLIAELSKPPEERRLPETLLQGSEEDSRKHAISEDVNTLDLYFSATSDIDKHLDGKINVLSSAPDDDEDDNMSNRSEEVFDMGSEKEAGIPAEDDEEMEDEEIDYNKLDRGRGFLIQGCQY